MTLTGTRVHAMAARQCITSGRDVRGCRGEQRPGTQQRWIRPVRRARLREERLPVELVPVFHRHAVGHAPDIDRVHHHGAAGRRQPHEGHLERRPIGEPACDPVAIDQNVIQAHLGVGERGEPLRPERPVRLTKFVSAGVWWPA
jgi:hypothetical protein